MFGGVIFTPRFVGSDLQRTFMYREQRQCMVLVVNTQATDVATHLQHISIYACT